MVQDTGASNTHDKPRKNQYISLVRRSSVTCQFYNNNKISFYYLIYLTLHWPILMNNPLIFVSFNLFWKLLYSRGIPFVINEYCSYQLSSIPVKYRSGIGVWLPCVWFGFNPPLGNIFFKVEINEKCAKHARVSLQAR